jgi:site-specific recombinase XerD
MYSQVNDDSRAAQEPVVPSDTVPALMNEFATAMEQERGLSTSTIERTRSAAEHFLVWCEQQHVGMSELRICHVDDYLALKGRQGWARSSVRTQAQWLRCFLRYAESRGWSGKGIADAIMTPRIYQQESLPAGPTWEQVQSLIASAGGERVSAIRDRAILMLLSVYGLRSGDVSRLRLEDLDWDKEKLEVTHPKQRRARQYPLIHSVGEAILDYLQSAPALRKAGSVLDVKEAISTSDTGGLVACGRRPFKEIGIHRTTRRSPLPTARMRRPLVG